MQLGMRACLLGSAILGLLFSAWMIVPELLRPSLDYWPLDEEHRSLPEGAAENGRLAARLGAVRGDLWTDYGIVLLQERLTSSGARVSDSTEFCETARRAARLSPFDARNWILIANGCSTSTSDALKMSYYTRPRDPRLTRTRVALATKSDAV